MHYRRIRAALLGLTVLATISTTSAVHATSVFSGKAHGLLTVTGITLGPSGLLDGNVFVEGLGVTPADLNEAEASGPGGSATTAGTSTVDGDSAVGAGASVGPLPLDVLSTITQDATVSGSQTGVGFAKAFAATDGIVLIDNLSDETVTVSFTFGWSIEADSFTDGPERADAFATVDVFWEVFDLATLDVLLLDALFPLPPDDESVRSDTDLGDGLVGKTGSEAFEIEVPAGAGAELVIFVNADGLAELVPVPEPGSLVLALAALAGLAVRRRARA
jgi:hypothetical protein